MQIRLITFLNHITPLPRDILDIILPYFQYVEYPKNHLLLRQGRPCQYIWLLMTGAVRFFHTDEQGKEVNVWFSLDHDIVSDAPSFVTQSPSLESIQLLEDSEFYAIHYSDLQKLLRDHHAFTLWYIRLVEKYYVSQIEDRITDLQFLNATQRYQKLLEQFPDITNRISLGHIASYLNITQETLSRIRAGKL